MFRVEGCGFAALLNDGKVIAGCSTTCTNYSYNIETHHCIGLGCCLTQIYGNLKSYSMDLTGLNMVDEDGACGSAFLGESRLSPIKRTGNGYYANTTMTLIWYLTDNDFHEIPNCWEPKSRPSYLALANGSSIVLRKCSCDVGRVGNPYLHYQCEESEYCRICRHSGGTCHHKETDPDYFDGTSWGEICRATVYYDQTFRSSKSPLGIILGKQYSLRELFNDFDQF
ncbi:hypothetical protein R6Q59_007761 [Mikania micrantha]